MTQDTPLVSCIMPTANRARFIPLSIAYFLRQNYANTELIIVDDGRESIAKLIPDNPKIRYIKLPKRATIGTKRNYACTMAKGEIIMHWDDDDWYTKNWISHQVSEILTSGADMCGLNRLIFYSPSSSQSWKYIYPDNEKPWVAGATMAYKKEIWRRRPFNDMQVGEDNDFVWNAGARLRAHTYLSGFVSILHPNNTSPKYTADSRWTPFNKDEVAVILNNDFRNYV